MLERTEEGDKVVSTFTKKSWVGMSVVRGERSSSQFVEVGIWGVLGCIALLLQCRKKEGWQEATYITWTQVWQRIHVFRCHIRQFSKLGHHANPMGRGCGGASCMCTCVCVCVNIFLILHWEKRYKRRKDREYTSQLEPKSVGCTNIGSNISIAYFLPLFFF